MTADQLRSLEPRQLLELLRAQVDHGLSLCDNLIETPPLPDLKGQPLLRLGDFTIFAREDYP